MRLVVNAEWKWNRFYRTVVDNTPSEDTNGYDIEIFPIESITKTDRPSAGINKAVVGQSYVQSEYHDDVPGARYYICSENDQYKYWQSPQSSGTGPSFTMTNCAPQVAYVEEEDVSGSPVPITVLSNKIYFTIENSFAWPVNYDVQIKTTTGGSWTTIMSNVSVPSDGRVVLWHTGGSNWSTTKTLGFGTNISAVRLVINSMNKTAFFNLIELGAGYELDISEYVSDTSGNYTMGEADFITPLGNISANEGSLSLFNDTGIFTNSNESSPLYNVLDKGVNITCWYKYGSTLIKEYTMISEKWKEDDSETEVTLTDNTKVLMEAKPPAVLYQNIPVQEAVWRICDTIGFTDYIITDLDTDPQSKIDVFWTDGEKTAWEVFSELSRASQTAIYIDSEGKLNIKTRGAAYRSAAQSSFTMLGESVPGGQLANIVNLQNNTEYEANKVKVNWKPTGFSEQVGDITPMEVVWEPENTTVIRASELVGSITNGSIYIPLSQMDGSTWPYSGIAQIEGEWIEYEGKLYKYYDENGVLTSAVINDLATKQKLDSKTNPLLRYVNQFTGHLKIKTRGLYNTQKVDHIVGLNGWTKSKKKAPNQAVISPVAGIGLVPAQSIVTIEADKAQKLTAYKYLHRGNTFDEGYLRLGTRIRIDKTSHTTKIGGIFFNADGGLGTGYFVEVTATSKFNAKMRRGKNEIVFYSMKSDGSTRQFGGEQYAAKDLSKNYSAAMKKKVGMGSEFAVAQGVFIDLDIIYYPGAGSNDDRVSIYANGKFLFQASIPTGWKHSKKSLFGLYARGNSSVSFDYVYGCQNFGDMPLDDESFYDVIYGGYRGAQWQKDWVYEVRYARRKPKKPSTKALQKYNQRYFDEFGPIAHEIRKFDVKFSSERPCLQSRLYFSNRSQVVCTEFWSDPTNAHFYLANISRENAVVHGDDTLTAGGAGTINHKLFVYGRPVIQKDQQSITKTDDWAIRRRGPIEVEYDSDWIQNEAEAENFAEWLTTNWSRSDSLLEVEIFGNPLIELTDVVLVDYENINSKYYVIGINNSFDRGLTTTLTLRRVSE